MTMMRAGTSSLVRTASRSAAARRQLSSQPKMHKAKDHWADLKAKRPVDQDDLHLVFHPPYNKATIIGLMTAVVGIGYGSMAYGHAHQQKKQGYW